MLVVFLSIENYNPINYTTRGGVPLNRLGHKETHHEVHPKHIPWMLYLAALGIGGGGGYVGSEFSHASQTTANRTNIHEIVTRQTNQEIATAGIIAELRATTVVIAEIGEVLKDVAKSDIQNQMNLIELGARVDGLENALDEQ